MKRVVIAILSIITMLFSLVGCEGQVGIVYDDPVLIYNGEHYKDTDEEGRMVDVSWTIPEDTLTKEVKVFYGEKNAEDQSPNEVGKVFESKDLDGWLFVGEIGVEEPGLYIKEDLVLPDYREDAEIEAIILCVNSKRIVIDDPNEIDTLKKDLISASVKARNHNERSSDFTRFYSIELKYKDCGALFWYGELEEDKDGNWCFIALDLNDDLIYQIGEESVEILDNHGIDFSIFDE